jgi:tripartite-type tricarboxylate transporter receptor subunit TctC
VAGIAQSVVAVLLLIGSGFVADRAAWAQAWPDKPVKVVVPWAAGGITDIVGRVFAQKLGEAFGQQFIVDNKPGAGGNIGADLVARSAPDGYTLLVTNPGAFATNQYLYSKMSYKPDDLTGVMLIAEFPNALMVTKDLPVSSVAELIDYAKKNPKVLNGASSGVGTSGHLSLEMFKSMTGTEIQNVFYKGAALSKVDLAAGRVQVAIDNIPSHLAEITSGSVRMLAVGTRTRLASFPDVPTLDEAGVRGYQSSVWYAMAAPRGTPAALVQRVNEASNAALRAPDVQERLKQLQGVAMGGSPEDANRFFAEEARRWKVVIETSGAKAD